MKIDSISKKYFLLKLLFFQVIVGCSTYNRQMASLETAMQPSTSKASPPTSDEPTYKTEASEAVWGIVLLHGWTMDKGEMDPLQKELVKCGEEKYGKEKLLIINSEAREGKTGSFSIEEQAEMVYSDVVSELARCGKDSRSFPLYIIGQSQGGLVAILMADRYADKLNLLGVLTHNTPLKGVDLLTRGPLDVRKLCARTAKGLESIKAKQDPNMMQRAKELLGAKVMSWLPLGLCNFIDSKLLNSLYRDSVGLRDMLPNSPCMKSMARYLRNNDQPNRVPCLLIGGYQDDYGKLVSRPIEDKLEFNKATAKFLTGDENGLHDTLISLKSQLCRGDSLEDLRDIGDKPYYMAMPGNPNVTCVALRGITHCKTFMPISDFLIEESGENESMMAPCRMVPVVWQFIDKQLKNANISLE